jgi:hypothetical protein
MAEEPPRSPLADEATRLLGAVQEWARQNFPAVPADHDHSGAPVCTWCPLCQFMAVLRGDRPEVTERVTEAGSALASALRAVLDAAVTGSASGAPRPDPSSRVQRIDLGGPDSEA